MTEGRVGLLRAEVLAYFGAPDPEARPDDPPWWLGTCDSSCASLAWDVLPRYSDLEPVIVMWGGFRGATSGGHCWVRLGDGTIVDPTSQQFGLEPCAVVAPGDSRYGWYVGGTVVALADA